MCIGVSGPRAGPPAFRPVRLAARTAGSGTLCAVCPYADMKRRIKVKVGPDVQRGETRMSRGPRQRSSSATKSPTAGLRAPAVLPDFPMSPAAPADEAHVAELNLIVNDVACRLSVDSRT